MMNDLLTLAERAAKLMVDAKQTIARLESMTSEHAEFADTIQALREKIRAHVAEEERLIFPRLRGTSFNGKAVGLAMAERRDVLMDVLGLHDDDEEGIANQRETRAGSQSSSQRPPASNPKM